MIYYINVNKKRIVGRNNQISTRPLNLEYDVTEVIDFQFIDDNNQLQPLSPNTPGLTLAIGLKQNMPSYDLLALSHDYEIVNGQTLRFTVNTYTVNWLKKINKANTEVFIEISQQSLESKKVWMRDYCYVWPRVYTAGLEPAEIESNDYYTKSETDEAIENAIEGIGISGYVTTEEFEEGLATKQNVIDDENKLSYELLSGTPTIPTKTSDLDNDSDFVTSGYVEDGLAKKQDVITNDNKLDYALLSGTPEIPDPAWGSISGTLSDQTDLQNALDEKQDLITEIDYLPGDYVHVDINHWSGDPDFTVQAAINMTRDIVYDALSGVDAVSGALTGKQDLITNDNKLDYSLISGAPATSDTSWGAITGTLSAQTDLQTALDAKAEQTDVNAISGELEATDKMLEEYDLLHTPFYIETTEANNSIVLSGIETAYSRPLKTISLKYSLDNLTWNDYDLGESISLSSIGDRVYFKGNNETFSYLYDKYYSIKSTSGINAGGNIMSLIDESMKKTTFDNHQCVFTHLFDGNQNIKDASKLKLPVTTLTKQCYNGMFYNCSALSAAPELPATTLATYCYANMFKGCSNLSEIKVHFTQWDSSYAYTANWVNGLAASGTFICPADLDTSVRGNNTIPEDWTVVNI